MGRKYSDKSRAADEKVIGPLVDRLDAKLRKNQAERPGHSLGSFNAMPERFEPRIPQAQLDRADDLSRQFRKGRLGPTGARRRKYR